jgi:putative transposase
MVKNTDGTIKISPTYFKKNGNSFKMGKRTIKKYRNLNICNDCRIMKKRGNYWLLVPIPLKEYPACKFVNYSGIDPGVRTFCTSFGNSGCVEYEHRKEMLDKLELKIKNLKKLRRAKLRKRIIKNKLSKLEDRKENLINELHWKVITNILKNTDVLFFGDINSHDIVRNGKNTTLNKDLMNLKFHKFKQRLQFKALERRKKVFLVPECFTTKTCSFCGTLNNPEKSKIYECANPNCLKKIGRDVNASKNILMKGLIQHIIQ